MKKHALLLNGDAVVLNRTYQLIAASVKRVVLTPVSYELQSKEVEFDSAGWSGNRQLAKMLGCGPPYLSFSRFQIAWGQAYALASAVENRAGQ